MLKRVAICSNLLVLCLLGVCVMGGIEFDVQYSYKLVPSNVDLAPLLSRMYTSFPILWRFSKF